MIVASTPSPWLPISLSVLSGCIAIAAFCISLWNFRLTRFPHVRAFFRTYYTKSRDYPNGETLFEVEVESWGLPVWDMRVALEADYRDALPELGRIEFEVVPVGTRPNPMNPGQVAKFRLTQSAVRELDVIVLKNLARPCGVSELAPDKVHLLIYGSGERVIKRIARKRFGFQFNIFDQLRQEREKSAP